MAACARRRSPSSAKSRFRCSAGGRCPSTVTCRVVRRRGTVRGLWCGCLSHCRVSRRLASWCVIGLRWAGAVALVRSSAIEVVQAAMQRFPETSIADIGSQVLRTLAEKASSQAAIVRHHGGSGGVEVLCAAGWVPVALPSPSRDAWRTTAARLRIVLQAIDSQQATRSSRRVNNAAHDAPPVPLPSNRPRCRCTRCAVAETCPRDRPARSRGAAHRIAHTPHPHTRQVGVMTTRRRASVTRRYTTTASTAAAYPPATVATARMLPATRTQFNAAADVKRVHGRRETGRQVDDSAALKVTAWHGMAC
jgi:hypothetical protein